MKIPTLTDALAVLDGEAERILEEGVVLSRRFSGAFSGTRATLSFHNEVGVVTFTPTRTTVDLRGHLNSTTKALVEKYLPLKIIPSAGVWKVVHENEPERLWLWTDGMHYSRDNCIRGANPAYAYYESAIRDSRRKAMEYTRSLVNNLRLGRLPKPGEEKCGLCALVLGNGESLGEALRNSEHIYNHVEYGHQIPVLLARAVETAPENVRESLLQALRSKWGPGTQDVDGAVWRELTRQLRRYLFPYLSLVR